MINDRVVFSSTVEFKSCETPEMSRRVELCYDTRNPYAIKATFVDTGWNMWLGRAFLKEGLVTDVSSYGLVKMHPSDDDPAMVFIKMVVSSTGDYSVFETKAQAIANILGRTYDVVPSGEEPRWTAWQSNLYDQSGFDGDLYLFAESGAGKIDKAEYDRQTEASMSHQVIGSEDPQNDLSERKRLYVGEPIKSEEARKLLQDLMRELGANAEAERRQSFSYRFKSFFRRHLRWCKAKS